MLLKIDFANLFNSCERKAGNMFSHFFDQIRRDLLTDKVLQITAPDGQKGAALIYYTHLAKQNSLICGFFFHNFFDDFYH